MKLYIKQKVFSFGSSFSVKDELGCEKYSVKGEPLSFRLHIFDESGSARVLIKRRLLSLLPRFEITIDGRTNLEIAQKLSLFTPRYTVNGCGWEIEGDLLAHDYRIMSGRVPVAAVRKKWISWGDSYEIEFFRPEDELAALAVVIAIDCTISDNDGLMIKT